MTKDKKVEKLNYAAFLIYKALESKGFADAYLEEKLDRLLVTDKFQAILFLHNCGTDIQEHVANEVGVGLAELKTAIRVIGHF